MKGTQRDRSGAYATHRGRNGIRGRLSQALAAASCGLALSAAPCAATNVVSHVIVVSVDGLGSVYFAPLLAAGVLPHYARLLDEGAGTLNARADYHYTVTLPNHTDMLTGRPVLFAATPDTVGHGFKINTDPGAPWTIHSYGNTNVPYIASMFDVTHDRGLSTASYVSKEKFDIYHRSWGPVYGASDEDPAGGDNGLGKIDDYTFNASTNGGVTTLAKAHTLIYGGAETPGFLAGLASNLWTLSFVHIQDPDNGGHIYGWGSAMWSNIVVATDGYIGSLLDTIENSPELAGRTAIILTSDHGALNSNHGLPSRYEDYCIPFLVWGAGVAGGYDLYEINPLTRADPGTARPTYTGARLDAIRNGEAANLALSLLGLPPVPGSFFNVAQDLNTGDILAVSSVRPADGAIELRWIAVGGFSTFDVRAAPTPDAEFTVVASNLTGNAWTSGVGSAVQGFFRIDGR